MNAAVSCQRIDTGAPALSQLMELLDRARAVGGGIQSLETPAELMAPLMRSLGPGLRN